MSIGESGERKGRLKGPVSAKKGKEVFSFRE